MRQLAGTLRFITNRVGHRGIAVVPASGMRQLACTLRFIANRIGHRGIAVVPAG